MSRNEGKLTFDNPFEGRLWNRDMLDFATHVLDRQSRLDDGAMAMTLDLCEELCQGLFEDAILNELNKVKTANPIEQKRQVSPP